MNTQIGYRAVNLMPISDATDLDSSIVVASSKAVKLVNDKTIIIDNTISNLHNSVVVSTPTINILNLAIGYENTITITAHSLLNNVKIKEFDIKIGNFISQTVIAENNTAIIKFTQPNDVVPGENIQITAIARDDNNSKSKVMTKNVIAVNAFINKPSIVSPVSDVVFNHTLSVTANSSEFSFIGNLSHAKTDWKLTSDIEGNTIVDSALNSTTDLLTHTFTLQSETVNKNYFIFVRYYSTNGIVSDWSSPTKITVNGKITTPGGRTLYRHNSNKGSVLEFNDGTNRSVLILDAVYRTSKKFGTYNTDVPGLTNYSTTNTRGDWYLNTTNAAVNSGDSIPVMTDSQINSLWSGSIDNKTSKESCDVWMTYNTLTDSQQIVGVPAVAYCRSIIINGTPCDLANIQTLMRIYLEQNEIDKLDPTVLTNPTKALGKSNTNQWWRIDGVACAWSCTECSAANVRYVNYLASTGNYSKSNTYAVIPISELTKL